MRCKECSELLIDYIHNQLSSEDKAAVKEHLSSCPKCLEEFEEYTEIRMAAQGEDLPEVSSEVLDRISKAASYNVRGHETPFWKKWLYSPILVPALTTALAISVWFYYGYDTVNIGPDIASVKIPAEGAVSEPEHGISVVVDNLQIEDNIAFEEQAELTQKGNIGETAKKSKTFKYEQMPPLVAPASSKPQEQAELDIAGRERDKRIELSRAQVPEVLAKTKPEASPIQEELFDSFEHQEAELENLRGQNEQSVIAKKEKESECDVSIKANEAIVNSTTQASKSTQQKSYKALAECYEQKGDFDRAISNYINLEQVAPEESFFANTRIQDIRNRIKLDQLRKEQMSDRVPAD